MPWQQMVADVAGEINPKTGLLIYRKVVVLVPRQSGKTILDLGENVYRAFGFGEPQVITYTAQTRNDARKKWVEHEKLLRRSPLQSMYTLREAAGSEEIRWSNDSVHGLASTTEKSGHGPSLDKGTIDEAFAQIDRRVEQAMRPSMAARPNAQLWVMSTAGNLQSIYLNEEIEKGRERIESGEPGRVAYFEFSASPDDDPDDEATWARCMPALGHTIDLSVVQAEHDDMPPRDFARAFLNITDTGAGAEAVVSADAWAATAADTMLTGPRAIAVDINNDRAWASIGWSGLDAEGYDLAELIRHERGTHWVIPFLVDKFARFPKYSRTVYVVAGSQAALMEDDFEVAGIRTVILSRADYAAACAKFYDGILHGTMRHSRDGQVPLDIAVAGAAWGIGDARVWSRTKSTAIVSPLVAASVALWGHALEAADNYDILDSIA